MFCSSVQSVDTKRRSKTHKNASPWQRLLSLTMNVGRAVENRWHSRAMPFCNHALQAPRRSSSLDVSVVCGSRCVNYSLAVVLDVTSVVLHSPDPHWVHAAPQNQNWAFAKRRPWLPQTGQGTQTKKLIWHQLKQRHIIYKTWNKNNRNVWTWCLHV